MTELFSIEKKDFINLRRFYKRAPKQFQKTTANVLNSFAFGTRKKAVDAIQDKMTVRNEKFVKSSFQVQTAKPNEQINSQKSVVGSIKRKRFSGWEEQQTGKRRKSSRVGTLLSRGKSEKKPIMPSARMKPGKSFISPKNFKGRTKQNKIFGMLRVVQKRKQPFILRGLKGFRPGLYRIFRGKIKRLQTFRSRKPQPKKLDWIGIARARYFKANPVRETWAKSIKHVLKLR